ncbi:MAG: DoxX family protein [Patescibacteria group bacterium]
MTFAIFYLFSDWALLIARVALGILLLAHGFPKLKDLKGTGEWMGSVGFKPGILRATVAALVEFLGGLMLIAGLFVQAVALLLAVQFVVILIWKLFARHKFIGDVELDLVILALVLILLTSGAGMFSLDYSVF